MTVEIEGVTCTWPSGRGLPSNWGRAGTTDAELLAAWMVVSEQDSP